MASVRLQEKCVTDLCASMWLGAGAVVDDSVSAVVGAVHRAVQCHN